MREPIAGHDIIVIGASAGGVEVTRSLMRDLPADLPAAIFLVLHIGEASNLAAILDAAGPLPATQARSGEPIANGRVYVAGPGAHLLLHDHHVLLRRGPRENLARPAIDPLFRSAAASFGGRVIAVVLSGTLNDGTAGLRAVKRCGGLAVVQDPADAAHPEMPASALRHVEVDEVAGIAALPGVLERRVREPAGVTPDIPFDIRLENTIAAQEPAEIGVTDALGAPSGFSCPRLPGRALGDPGR